MSDSKRLERELETREVGAREQNWAKPEMLPSPKPQDGWIFRYIRIGTRGGADPTNFSSKIREGWEPCKASDHPEIELVSVENERFKDNIVMGGLMLCKMPEKMANQRNKFYAAQTKGQMESVDNNLMRESDPRMPLFNSRKSSRTQFGDGS